MEDDAKCERIAELLCQHDYADIDPECKLYILEKLCVAISELYKSKLAIAKDMGLVSFDRALALHSSLPNSTTASASYDP